MPGLGQLFSHMSNWFLLLTVKDDNLILNCKHWALSSSLTIRTFIMHRKTP